MSLENVESNKYDIDSIVNDPREDLEILTLEDLSDELGSIPVEDIKGYFFKDVMSKAQEREIIPFSYVFHMDLTKETAVIINDGGFFKACFFNQCRELLENNIVGLFLEWPKSFKDPNLDPEEMFNKFLLLINESDYGSRRQPEYRVHIKKLYLCMRGCRGY